MNKEQLKQALEKKELVKPNSIEERVSKEVEALCESFGCTANVGRASGDTGDENDILV